MARRSRAHPPLQARGLTKKYSDGRLAVVGVDLDVEPGEILALLGPNGAGKSTTVQMLATLLQPSSGSAAVLGLDVMTKAPEIRRYIGVALQEVALDPLLDAREHMQLQASLHGIARRDRRRRVEACLESVGLSSVAERRVAALSGGMRRRLDLGMALLHQPRVLFLDEPTTGLDPESRQLLWAQIRLLKEGGITILLTTQYLEEADALADTVAIMVSGKIAIQDTPTRLKKMVGQYRIGLLVDASDVDRAVVALAQRNASQSGKGTDCRAWIDVPAQGGTSEIPMVIGDLTEANITVRDVEIHTPTLEDVYWVATDSSNDNSQAAA